MHGTNVLTMIVTLLTIAYLFGIMATYLREPFLNDATNPVQDRIQWMHPALQCMLWPLWTLVWWGARWLDPMHGEHYFSHRDQMDAVADMMIDEMYRELSGDFEIEYDIPSPKEWRERGKAALEMTAVYES